MNKKQLISLKNDEIQLDFSRQHFFFAFRFLQVFNFILLVFGTGLKLSITKHSGLILQMKQRYFHIV